MIRFGKPLKPLNADVKYIPGARGSSSKKFKEEYKKAKKWYNYF